MTEPGPFIPKLDSIEDTGYFNSRNADMPEELRREMMESAPDDEKEESGEEEDEGEENNAPLLAPQPIVPPLSVTDFKRPSPNSSPKAPTSARGGAIGGVEHMQLPASALSREPSPPGSLESSTKSVVASDDSGLLLPLSHSSSSVVEKSPPAPGSRSKFKINTHKVDTFAYTNHSLLYEMSLADAASARGGTPRGSGMSTPRSSGALTPRGTRLQEPSIRSSGSGVPPLPNVGSATPSSGGGAGGKYSTPENSARGALPSKTEGAPLVLKPTLAVPRTDSGRVLSTLRAASEQLQAISEQTSSSRVSTGGSPRIDEKKEDKPLK